MYGFPFIVVISSLSAVIVSTRHLFVMDEHNQDIQYWIQLAKQKHDENDKLNTQILFLREQIQGLNDQSIKQSELIVNLTTKIDSLLVKNTNVKSVDKTMFRKRPNSNNSDTNASKVTKSSNANVVDDMDLTENANNTSIADDNDVSNNYSSGIKSADHHEPNITLNVDGNKNWADIVGNDENVIGKTMPIQLKLMKPTKITIVMNLIREKFGDKEYSWRQLGTNVAPRIFTNDIETKKQIMGFLRENGIEFNTYAEKTSKRKAYIVRGLCYGDDNINIGGINDALINHGICGNIEIKRFMTGHMRKNQDKYMPLYQIVFDADVTDSNIGNIKQVNSFQIKIEKMKKSGVAQCKRCQRFLHTASSCSHSYRCVQCVAKHQPGQCPRANNGNLPLACINCKEAGLNAMGHTANDLTHCQYYLQNYQQKGKKNTTTTNTPRENVADPQLAGTTSKATHTTQSNDIIHNTVANEPTLNKKKTKKLIKQYRANSGDGNNGKSNRIPSVEPTRDQITKFNELRRMANDLIKALKQFT